MRHLGRVGLCLAILASGLAFGSMALANPYVVANASTGQVLASEDATRPWYPASLSKLMTAYVVFKAVEQGRVDLGTPIVISRLAANQAPSKMGYPVGTMVTIDDALKMLMVKSANDIAIALAEGVSGSVDAFAGEMNAHSRRLGMRQSHWVNPNGLPDPGQVTSARDMALLAAAIYRDFPQYRDLFRINAIKSGRRVMRNHNSLVYRYPGADGMKTGFICASGYNVVATATRGGNRLITVVLGASSARKRSDFAADLFEANFGGGSFFGGVKLNGLPDSPYTQPADIRDEICSKKRRRAADPEEADDATLPAGGAGGSQSPLDVMLQQQAKTGKGGAAAQGSPYLATRWVLDPPIEVGPYTGDRRPTPSEPVAVAALADPQANRAIADPGPAVDMPVAPARPLKLGAIMQDTRAGQPPDSASAYAATEKPLVLPTAPVEASAAGAILPPVVDAPAEKGDRLTPAQRGQIPRAVAEALIPAAVAGEAADGATTVLVPLPPPRPRNIPKLARKP